MQGYITKVIFLYLIVFTSINYFNDSFKNILNVRYILVKIIYSLKRFYCT